MDMQGLTAVGPWQERLECKLLHHHHVISLINETNCISVVCRDAQLRPPVFQIVSDRRGMLPCSTHPYLMNVF